MEPVVGQEFNDPICRQPSQLSHATEFNCKHTIISTATVDFSGWKCKWYLYSEKTRCRYVLDDGRSSTFLPTQKWTRRYQKALLNSWNNAKTWDIPALAMAKRSQRRRAIVTFKVLDEEALARSTARAELGSDALLVVTENCRLSFSQTHTHTRGYMDGRVHVYMCIYIIYIIYNM